MVKLLLLFKELAGDSFEADLAHNIDLLKQMKGWAAINSGSIFDAPSGDSAYSHMIEVHFASRDALYEAMTSPQGEEAGRDLMRFAAGKVEIFFVDFSTGAAASEPEEKRDDESTAS